MEAYLTLKVHCLALNLLRLAPHERAQMIQALKEKICFECGFDKTQGIGHVHLGETEHGLPRALETVVTE